MFVAVNVNDHIEINGTHIVIDANADTDKCRRSVCMGPMYGKVMLGTHAALVMLHLRLPHLPPQALYPLQHTEKYVVNMMVNSRRCRTYNNDLSN